MPSRLYILGGIAVYNFCAKRNIMLQRKTVRGFAGAQAVAFRSEFDFDALEFKFGFGGADLPSTGSKMGVGVDSFVLS